MKLGPGVTLKVPVVYHSLGFDGASNQHVQITGSPNDWALGDIYTIEWWEKVDDASLGTFYSVLCQSPNNNCIDAFHNNGFINLFNADVQITQPTSGVWNHIAVQKDGTTFTAYFNGQPQTVSHDLHNTLSEGSLNLVVGSRTSDGGGYFYGQYYKGLLTNIRISSVARYSGAFTPPLALAVDANTRLALDGDLVDKSPSAHTIINNGATVSTDLPT